MQELFRKYLDGQCSPNEVKQLLEYFNNPESEVLLRQLLIASLENTEVDYDENQWQPATDQIFDQIKKRLATQKEKVIPLNKQNWIRIAAAVILLIGAYSLYNYINRTGISQRAIAKTDTVSDEIGPGGNKAILTLTDGTTINLETATADALPKQGNTNLLKLASGQLTYKSLNEKPANVLFNSVTTPRGGQYQVTLSDGSRVWLNAASSIHFPVAFMGRERTVEITGEVYFEVTTLRLASGQKIPFKVKIGDKAEVEVLGTHFNINAYADEPTINATLLEGSIKVTGPGHNESRIIVPGEQALLNANSQIKINKQANVEQVVAWKNGIFNFDNADLETSLRQIARWYNVDIIFEGAVPRKKFSGEMQRSLSMSQVLKLLETNNVYCHIEGRKLIVLK
jgi:ferric-dicitrate binding protein FerR (iron transport regulator)